MVIDFVFNHPFCLDEPTERLVANLGTIGHLNSSPGFPSNTYYLEINPAEFFHAHARMCSTPLLYGKDIRDYLSTINTYFQSFPNPVPIQLPAGTADHKKREAEDFGVCLACFFVVRLFKVEWLSICQIPRNRKLATLTPDFKCFDTANAERIFEAKGTTDVGYVIKQMEHGILQAKSYPGDAVSKTVFATFIKTDPRIFPSMSFVVDPAAPRGGISVNAKLAAALHFKKLLHFLGLHGTADTYIKVLIKNLSLFEGREGTQWEFKRSIFLNDEVKNVFEVEREKSGLRQVEKIEGRGYYVREIDTGIVGLRMSAGVSRQLVEDGLGFGLILKGSNVLDDKLVKDGGLLTSYFGDETFLELDGRTG